MPPAPYLQDRSFVSDAVALMRDHGADASAQAAKRASRSRGLGNHVHFCRWRQVGRLIDLMSDDRARGTIH